MLTFAARAERELSGLPGVGVKYRCKIFNLVTVSAITALERFILQPGVLANRDRVKVRKANSLAEHFGKYSLSILY